MPLASFEEDADLTTGAAQGAHIAGDNLSIWREGRIPWRQGDRDYNGVFLGWNRAPGAPAAAYTITLPDGAAAKWGLNSASALELSVAALDEDAPLPGKRKDEAKKKPEKSKPERESPDFTIELESSDAVTVRAPASRFAAIPPPLKEKFTKLSFLDSQAYEKDWEPVFQTVRAPLGAFGGDSRFDARKLLTVRLKFDRTAKSVICISGVGFERR